MARPLTCPKKQDRFSLEAPVAPDCKHYLFMGSMGGGGGAYAIARTLIETAKMNNADPEAWLAWVLRAET